MRVLSSCNSGGCSQKEIAEKTGLAVRSVKAALKILKLKGALTERFLINDMRCKLYNYGGKENGNK
ncbi:winged helix-turn-helix transcriptional regulator [Candidatus Woesearchaeota archaeon]|nr:winged helix-turn-helix transcriptional regulator [Candidatus Woesearchaeota archaeon]